MNSANKPQRRALGEWAVGSLYDRIFTGELPVGADLGEESLCQVLDVSRATVSFALRQLEQDGMITVAAGNGRRQVKAFSVEDLADLYNVRIALEGFSVSRAATRMSLPAIAELEQLQDEMEALSRRPDRPSTRDFGIDFDFHRVIARESASKRALSALQPIWNQSHALLRHLYSIGAYADRAEDAASYADHRTIIDALKGRDPERARQRMVDHLSGRRDTLIRNVTKQGALG